MALPSDSHPVAHESKAFQSIRRAADLDNACFASEQEALIGAPDNFTEDQKKQREAIIKVATTIIRKARDRAMDEAVAHWLTYRRMTKT